MPGVDPTPIRGLAVTLCVFAALVACAGCSNIITHQGQIAFNRTADPGDFNRLVDAAARGGYEIALAHPERQRFGVYAKFRDKWVETYGRYRIAVMCTGTICRIRPFGPRVEAQYTMGVGYELPEPLRDELLVFQQLLQSAVNAPGAAAPTR